MILVLDNHDSFVHNLARYLRRACVPTAVVRSDAIDVAGCRALAPSAILLSPGPKRPEDAGCCVDVVRELGTTVPILGVCLGHQAVGHAFGAKITEVTPMHGRASQLSHNGRGLFRGCPNPMTAARYHSLAIDASSLGDGLEVTAVTHSEGGVIPMAVRHRRRPIFGVQFHPESVLTPEGDRILANFLQIVRAWWSSDRPHADAPAAKADLSRPALLPQCDALPLLPLIG